MTPTILCVGTATLDMVLLADRLPDDDDRVIADDIALVGGGNAANSAAAIARLGLEVEFCGTVGRDVAGDLIVADLERAGVGTTFVERREGVHSAQSAVVVNSRSASRAIITYPAPPPPPIPAGFALVHLDKWGWASMPAAGLAGATISVDEGSPIADLDLSLVDWYAPTAALLGRRYGTTDTVLAARRAKQAGARTVVATGGERGSFALGDDGLHVAAALPGPVYSTLGAGDVFHGALVAAIALGYTSTEEILAFANVTAGLACRALDGRGSLPTRAEVEAKVRDLPRISLNEAQLAERFVTPID